MKFLAAILAAVAVDAQKPPSPEVAELLRTYGVGSD